MKNWGHYSSSLEMHHTLSSLDVDAIFGMTFMLSTILKQDMSQTSGLLRASL